MLSKNISLFLVLLLVLSMALSACGVNKTVSTSKMYALASLKSMPEEVQNAPGVVTQAYQFAVANPDVLTELPCYCGCGGMGHTSNYACYVAGENSDGSLTFDNHALGCSICVDITVDAMRMLDEGKSITEIRSYVDQTYSAFGPSNMP